MKRVLILLLVLVLVSCGPATALFAAPAQQAYTVVFKGTSLPADAAEIVQAAGGEVVLAIPAIGVIEARAAGGFVGLIVKNSAVQAAGPSLPFTADVSMVERADISAVNPGTADLYNIYQWDIKRVTNHAASYALGTGSHDVVVAVIDTGIFPHPDLAMNLLGGRNLIPSGGFGDDPTETGHPLDYWDRNGHGTHCAGTIAANRRVLGVAPETGLRAYRVLTAGGSGYTSWIAAGMVAAVDDGCRVISMSLGGYDVLGQVWWTDPVTGEKFRLGNDVAPFLAYRRAVQYAESRGAIVVASAGNDALNAIRRNEVTAFLNEEYGQHGYTFVGATFKVPAGTAGVISVSATGPDDSLSSYSTYGPGFVDVAAPGGDFQRWPAPGWHLDMCLSTYADYDPAAGTVWLGYAFMAGTSMAAPKVSAVAALVAAQNPGFGPAQIKAAVIGSAEDLGQPGYDWYYGHGLVNAYRALGGQ